MNSTCFRTIITIVLLFLITSNILGGATEKPAPMIVVEAKYPGANPSVVADTVGAPIEQQVNGVEGVLQMASRAGNDGSYVLALTLKPGTDFNKIQTLVQNRVTLALPTLPEVVKQIGVTVKKKSPVLMLINVASPNGKFDTLYLSNYAEVQLKDELIRVPGVGAITSIGMREPNMRILLDPAKLTARGLTAVDVTEAIRKQNVQVASGRVGQPPVPPGTDFQYSLNSLGRLQDAKDIEDIAIKADKDGNLTRLKDVGRVELGAAASDGDARFNGKPGVVLSVFPVGTIDSKRVSQAVTNKLSELRKRLPEGLNVDVVLDVSTIQEAPKRTAPEFLLFDIEMPDGASVARIDGVLKSCEELLREMKEIQDVLALPQSPFDIIRTPPCILMRLAPAGQKNIDGDGLMKTIRKKLDPIQGVKFKMRELSRAGGQGYSLDVAISGAEQATVRELAEAFALRLQKSKMLSNVLVDTESKSRPSMFLDIDRGKAKDLGVAMADIFKTIETFAGSMYVNDFNRFGRTWQVNIGPQKNAGDSKEIMKLQIRNNQGEMVPLAKLAEVRTLEAPAVVHRIDLRPAVFVTAQIQAGTTRKEVEAHCEREFAAARNELQLPATYRLTWGNSSFAGAKQP